jgi:peptide/nickel transport system permease protein
MAEDVLVHAPTRLEEEEEEIFVASQWRLMWWRFRKHKLAMAATLVVGVFYITFPLAEFLGFGDPGATATKFHLLRPQPMRFFDEGSFRPHINGLKSFRDPETFRRDYQSVEDVKYPVGLFVHGFEYKFLGFISTDRHLIGFSDPEHNVRSHPSLFLLGSDSVGRDQWSRLMLATRISLSIGLVGVSLALMIGIVLGGVSGYYGGLADTIIQRIIEIMIAVPTLPLWMGLSAAIPREWPVLRVYLAITIILSIFQWTTLARVVRGRFLSLREDDFVMAARLAGSSESRIMFRHMLPSFYSHIIAHITLTIPSMIISETALSFLGLGLIPPAVSYGVMLKEAQNPATVAVYPWLMFVAIPVIIVILAFNFLGDGLRDAADPYGK